MEWIKEFLISPTPVWNWLWAVTGWAITLVLFTALGRKYQKQRRKYHGEIEYYKNVAEDKQNFVRKYLSERNDAVERNNELYGENNRLQSTIASLNEQRKKATEQNRRIAITLAHGDVSKAKEIHRFLQGKA